MPTDTDEEKAVRRRDQWPERTSSNRAINTSSCPSRSRATWAHQDIPAAGADALKLPSIRMAHVMSEKLIKIAG